jgi:GT2 family glycosyltransferase
MNELCVIVVTYNSGRVLDQFLASLPKDVRTIVVDNASKDDVAAVAEKYGAELIALKSNVGYGGACNKGAEATDAEFLLFANPDIRFSGGAIEALLKTAKKYPRAAFNPSIYSRWKRPFRKGSRLVPDASAQMGSETDCIVPVLSGACILVRRKHFARIGGFDPAIFLFHEDDDLSLRLSQAGIELRLAADAAVDHYHGDSSGRSADIGRIKGRAMAHSLVYVMRKHGLFFDLQAERFKARMKMFLPHVFLNSARRAKHLAFLRALTEEHAEAAAGSKA